MVGAWLLSTLLVFLILREHIGPPVDWWGGSLRLPVVAALLSITLVAPTCGCLPPRPRALTLVPFAAVAFAFSAQLHTHVARFSRHDMAGLDRVLDAAPPGRRLCPLHSPSRALNELPGEPHGYLGNYYVAARMGVVPQAMFGNPGVPYSQNTGLPSPGWGRMEGLHSAAQLQGCELVLLELDTPHSEVVRARLEPGAFVTRAEHGRWALLEARSE